MKKLENKIAIITGAGSGMGRATAKLFASEGSKVVAADIKPQGLDSLVQEVTQAGGFITTVIADMSKTADIDKLFNAAIEHYETVDILVNNAGIMDDFSPAGEVDENMLQKVIDINLTGPVKAIKRAINIMLPKGKGCIINIASIGGLAGARAGVAYTASKFGLIGVTKNTAFLYAKKGIRCNAIAPGGVETNIGEGEFMKKMNIGAFEIIQPGMALNPKMGKPEDIANAVLYLASEEAGFVNGAVLTVDGGWTAY